MEKYKINTQPMSIRIRDVLTDILRQGAQKMPAEAIENEVIEYLDRHACVQDDQSHWLAVRSEYPSLTVYLQSRYPDVWCRSH